MRGLILFAEPWWVNLFVLIPVATYLFLRKRGVVLTKNQLFIAAFFGIAFGFVETSVVIYLRAAVGLLPGYGGILSDAANLSAPLYQQAEILARLPKALLLIEFIREAATIAMLVAVALFVGRTRRERVAAFLWAFAFWDIFYYVGLWLTIRWPSSLLTQDVLFLIPVPWLAQVWFPILISGTTILAIATAKRRKI